MNHIELRYRIPHQHTTCRVWRQICVCQIYILKTLSCSFVDWFSPLVSKGENQSSSFDEGEVAPFILGIFHIKTKITGSGRTCTCISFQMLWIITSVIFLKEVVDLDVFSFDVE